MRLQGIEEGKIREELVVSVKVLQRYEIILKRMVIKAKIENLDELDESSKKCKMTVKKKK